MYIITNTTTGTQKNVETEEKLLLELTLINLQSKRKKEAQTVNLYEVNEQGEIKSEETFNFPDDNFEDKLNIKKQPSGQETYIKDIEKSKMTEEEYRVYESIKNDAERTGEYEDVREEEYETYEEDENTESEEMYTEDEMYTSDEEHPRYTEYEERPKYPRYAKEEYRRTSKVQERVPEKRVEARTREEVIRTAERPIETVTHYSPVNNDRVDVYEPQTIRSADALKIQFKMSVEHELEKIERQIFALERQEREYKLLLRNIEN